MKRGRGHIRVPRDIQLIIGDGFLMDILKGTSFVCFDKNRFIDPGIVVSKDDKKLRFVIRVFSYLFNM